MRQSNINGKMMVGYFLIGCMSVSVFVGCGTKNDVKNISAKNEVVTSEQENENETETETQPEQGAENETEIHFAFEDEIESGECNVSIDSSLDEIIVSWNNVDKAAFYRLYKVDMSKVKKDEDGNYDNYVQMDKKLIVKLGDFEGNIYRDKDVKYGNDYRYYIEAIGNEDGNEKAITFSWSEYRHCGLSKPKIGLSDYDGTDYSFDEQNAMFINFGEGTFPDGYILYRKAEGEKEFKKIDEISDKVIRDLDYYCDTKVEYKKKYTYKVKTYKMKNGERIYSEDSEELVITTTNYYPTYKVSLEGNSQNGREGFEFSIKSDKDNSDTVFYKSGGYFGEAPLIMSKYSTDNKNWKEIPKEGVVLKEEEKLYFKFETTDEATIDKFENQIEIKGLNAMPSKLIIPYSYEERGGFNYNVQYLYNYEYLELFFSDGTSGIGIDID